MYVITYKGKPATYDKLWKVESTLLRWNHDVDYIAAATKKRAIEMCLCEFGFTWPERPKGVECQKVQVVS